MPQGDESQDAVPVGSVPAAATNDFTWREGDGDGRRPSVPSSNSYLSNIMFFSFSDDCESMISSHMDAFIFAVSPLFMISQH